MSQSDWKTPELLAAVISRKLEDGGHGFIGLGTGGRAFIMAVGVPSLAIELAKRSRQIDYTAQYGVTFEPDLAWTPPSFADPYLLTWPSMAQVPVEHCLDFFRRGKIDIGFTSGAQIDRRGNINTVSIGPQTRPKVRLVGPIAASDHATYAKHTMIVMPQERRTFVERLDFCSAIGYGNSPDDRSRLGLPGGGPVNVFTDLCVWSFDSETKEMYVESIHPEVTREQVIDSVSFPFDLPQDIPTTDPPSAEELQLIREEIDPEGLFLQARIA